MGRARSCWAYTIGPEHTYKPLNGGLKASSIEDGEMHRILNIVTLDKHSLGDRTSTLRKWKVSVDVCLYHLGDSDNRIKDLKGFGLEYFYLS